jgi:hypothetical protein
MLLTGLFTKFIIEMYFFQFETYPIIYSKINSDQKFIHSIDHYRFIEINSTVSTVEILSLFFLLILYIKLKKNKIK